MIIVGLVVAVAGVVIAVLGDKPLRIVGGVIVVVGFLILGISLFC